MQSDVDALREALATFVQDVMQYGMGRARELKEANPDFPDTPLTVAEMVALASIFAEIRVAAPVGTAVASTHRTIPASIHGAPWLLVVPRFEVPEAVRASRIERAALEHLYDVFTLYTAEVVANGRADVRGYTKLLRDSGTVVSLDPLIGKARVYPSFQFDDQVQVQSVVAEVNRLLDAGSEPHAAASWWATPNARLSGSAPFELADNDTEADRLIEAAKATVAIDF